MASERRGQCRACTVSYVPAVDRCESSTFPAYNQSRRAESLRRPREPWRPLHSLNRWEWCALSNKSGSRKGWHFGKRSHWFAECPRELKGSVFKWDWNRGTKISTVNVFVLLSRQLTMNELANSSRFCIRTTASDALTTFNCHSMLCEFGQLE